MVKDTKVNEHNGTLTDWRISLWGECIDPAKQSLHPMPTDHDDDDHDTVSAVVATTTLPPSPSQTELPVQPSDHIDRPVNSKTTSTPSASAATTIASSSSTESTTNPTSGTTAGATPAPEHSAYLPSIFPTFGVSPRTQIWIYGAASVIVLFCVALGIFFFVQRRRRARTSRADYEFEMIDDHDAGAGEPLSGGKARKKRRGGELYDAFAGESDEEIFSEGEEAEYRDEDPQKEKVGGSPERRGTSEK